MMTTYSPDDVSFSDMLLLLLKPEGRRPNMLVLCPDSEVQTVFERVHNALRLPFSVCLLPGPLDLPAGRRGTLLLHDIAALTLHQQIALFDWMNRTGSEVQVVSMTRSPMLPLVQTGRFLEGLFYRLTTISFVARSA